MKFFLFSAILLILNTAVVSQEQIGSLHLPEKLKNSNTVISYYSGSNKNIIVNVQRYNRIERILYDSNFNLVSSYTNNTINIALVNSADFIPIYYSNGNIGGANYEIYSCKQRIVVVQTDFVNKRDSILFNIDFKSGKAEERGLSAVFYADAIRILTYTPKSENILVYQWIPGKKTDTLFLQMPESSIPEEQKRIYNKDYKVNYKKLIGSLIKAYPTKPSIFATAEVAQQTDKIRLLFGTPYNTGYNLLELDIADRKILTTNFILNDMRFNVVEATNESRRIPIASVYSNILVIRNTSDYYFEYSFYDLNTKKVIACHKAGPDKSLRNILHSEFIQIGTWGSKDEKKDVDNEKAFLRKLSSGIPYLYVSPSGNDSILITTGSFIPTEGIGGFLLSLSTGFLTSMANLHVGNYQVIFYLTILRYKLIISESKFSLNDFKPSFSFNQPFTIHPETETAKFRGWEKKHSFFLQDYDNYIFAFYNEDKQQFDLFRLNGK